MRDRVGQLGEIGEYWMGRLRVIWCQIWSSKVVAPTCVDWGLIVWPRWTRLNRVLTHTGFMGSHKLSSFNGRWVGWHSTVLHGWHWDSVRATHGLPGEVFAWKTALGYDGPISTLWYSMWKVATRDTCVVHVCCVVRLFPLQDDYWFKSLRHPQIWVKLVRYCHSVEVLFHYVHMRLMVMFNDDYLVVKNDDTKKWLIELPRMFSIGC
jgi:hypothetical protein